MPGQAGLSTLGDLAGVAWTARPALRKRAAHLGRVARGEEVLPVRRRTWMCRAVSWR